MSEPRRLALSAVCPGARMSRDDGAPLRAAIERALADGAAVEVDLEGARLASLSFLDEALAAMLLDHPVELVRERVRLINVHHLVRATLNRLARTRVPTLPPDAVVF